MRRNQEDENPIALGTRKKIFGLVEANPGLHFREIQRRLGIATGALQYHLDYLMKHHYLKTQRQGKFLRYYNARVPELGARQPLMNALRQDSLRKILLFLVSKRHATTPRIAAAVGLSTSTVSWHLKKLLENGLVSRKTLKGASVYLVRDKRAVGDMVKNYRASFIDALVDNFVNLWDESGKNAPGAPGSVRSFEFPKLA